MGTLVEITVIGRDADKVGAAISDAFDEMERVEGLMSRRIPGSDVSRINRWAGIKAVDVSAESLRVIRRAEMRMQEKRFLRLISSMGNVGVILISALPIKGFGILSGSVFSFLIGQKRFEGTLLLMVGSVLGIAIVFGLTTGVLQIISLF